MLFWADCHVLAALDDVGVTSVTGMEGFGCVWAAKVALDWGWTIGCCVEVRSREGWRWSLGTELKCQQPHDEWAAII